MYRIVDTTGAEHARDLPGRKAVIDWCNSGGRELVSRNGDELIVSMETGMQRLEMRRYNVPTAEARRRASQGKPQPKYIRANLYGDDIVLKELIEAEALSLGLDGAGQYLLMLARSDLEKKGKILRKSN